MAVEAAGETHKARPGIAPHGDLDLSATVALPATRAGAVKGPPALWRKGRAIAFETGAHTSASMLLALTQAGDFFSTGLPDRAHPLSLTLLRLRASDEYERQGRCDQRLIFHFTLSS
jgi:hypothetical protein